MNRISFLLRSALSEVHKGTKKRRPASPDEIQNQWRLGRGGAVLRQMGVERKQFLDRWKRQNQNLTERYGCALADIRWTSRTTLGARLIPERHNGRSLDCTVEVDRGTMLAIDDVAGCVFAGAGFLGWYDKATTVRPKPIILADGFSNRFIHYPSEQHCRLDAAKVMAAVPSDERRMRSAALFSTLALDWVHLHEQSHFLLGHCEFLFRKLRFTRLQALDEATVSAGTNTTGGEMERRVLEFQADAQALELLFLQNLSDDGRRPVDLLQENPTISAQTRRPTLGSKRGLNAYRRAARILTVAAGVVALLFERSRELHDRGAFHPLPSARLLHLLLVGASLTEEFLGHYRTLAGLTPLGDDALHKMLVSLLVECQADLSIAALIIGIKDPDLVYDETSSSLLSTALFEDLFIIFGKGEEFDGEALAVRSAGAREFADVHTLNGRIFDELVDCHKGGALLSSRLKRANETR